MNNLYLQGDWKPGHGLLLERRSPCSGDFTYQGNSAGEIDITQAIAFASNNLSSWALSSRTFRIECIDRFSALLLKNQDALARCIRDEVGKPLWEAKLEVESAAQKAAVCIQAEQERFINTEWSRGNLHGSTRYKPYGLTAVIGPFNLPLHLPNAQIMPALLAGNCILFKPSELTPKVAEMYVKLWENAGLPSYALQLLQGGPSTAQMLLDHKAVKGVYFTGSYAVGQKIAQASISIPGRIVALEMGGNNPLIVCPTAQNREGALISAISGFITSGQRCTCARRVIVIESSTSDFFIEKLVETAQALRTGIPSDSFDPLLGPLVSERAHANLVMGWNRLTDTGARVLLPLDTLEKSLVTPAVIDTTAVDCPDEELFGPIIQVVRSRNLSYAIQAANATEYGLVAAVLTHDRQEWEQAANSLQAGIINWNCATIGASGKAPFGGIGKSGNCRPAGYFACDSCAYPVAFTTSSDLEVPSFIPSEMLSL